MENTSGNPIQKIKNSLEDSVSNTVTQYTKGVIELEQEFGKKIMIHPVIPPSNRLDVFVLDVVEIQKDRMDTVRIFNLNLKDQLGHRVLDIYEKIHEDHYLKEDFKCDGIHMNHKYLSLFEQSVNDAMKKIE